MKLFQPYVLGASSSWDIGGQLDDDVQGKIAVDSADTKVKQALFLNNQEMYSYKTGNISSLWNFQPKKAGKFYKNEHLEENDLYKT